MFATTPDATVKFAESFEEGIITDDGALPGSNFNELGNLGDSNEEGEEADIYNEGVNLQTVLETSNEPILDDADNIDQVLQGCVCPLGCGNFHCC